MPGYRFFLTAVNRQESLENRQEYNSCQSAVRKEPTGMTRQEKRTFPDSRPVAVRKNSPTVIIHFRVVRS
jgi:hypothetical protein